MSLERNAHDDGFPAGGFLTKDWNYNFLPGTTSRVMPLEALRPHFEIVEATTTECFASGPWLMMDKVHE